MSLASLWVCVHSAVGCCLQHCSSLSPCLAACTGLTFDLSSSSSDTALPQWFTLSMLGSFSKAPCVLWLDDFTALFLLLLTLHACRFLQSHSSAFICFFHFLPLYRWAEDTVVLHGAGPGYSSRPRALAQPLALGRKPRWCRAAPVLGQPCDGSSKRCRDLLFHLASLILTLNTQLRNNGIC